MQINIIRLSILIITTGILIFFMLNRRISPIKKIYYILMLIGIFIYSGISTTYEDLCEEYFGPFLVYIFVLTIGFLTSEKLPRLKIGNVNTRTFTSYLDTRRISDKLLIVLVILNFSYTIMQLSYPVNRWGSIFNITLSVVDIFEKQTVARTGALYQIFYYVKLATNFFFYIAIYRLVDRKKVASAVLLFFLKIYLEIAVTHYVGRSGFLCYILFVMFIIIYTKNTNKLLKKSIRTLTIFGILFLVAVPLLYAYQFSRLGATASNVSYGTSFAKLMQAETTYGRFYKRCIELSSFSSFSDYVKWFITLPLPSAFFKFKESIILANQALSESVLGIAKGESGFFIYLPSLLGEAFYVNGRIFYFVHALFIGLFSGKFCSMMESGTELGIANLWFASSFLLMGRGGSTGYISECVNQMIFFLILMFFIRRIRIRGFINFAINRDT